MQRDELRKLDNKKLAKWICNNILLDDCENCPLGENCEFGNSAVLKLLEKEDKGIKGYECVSCKRMFDCPGKLKPKECNCYEER